MSILSNKVLLASWITLVNTQIISVHSAPDLLVQNDVMKNDGPSYEYYKMPSSTELNSAEFELMKAILSNAIKDYNRKISRRFKYMRIVQPNYGIQYKVTLSQKGDKIVEINAFAKKMGDDTQYRNLNSEEVIVFDGGSSFFNTAINLKTRRAERISIHGFA
jgi:hypothetical protein